MTRFTPYQAVTYREKLLTANIEPASQKGLEVGALHNPIIRSIHGDVRFVDFADTQTLHLRFADKPDWAAVMVDVDYVWTGSGSLRDVIGTDEWFDWVIASHVIEHVPNMLGWLRGISDILRPGGALNLAIPDRRFTFDVRCPESTLGELVEADLLNYKIPSIRQVFDNCYYGKAIGPGALWHEPVDVDSLPRFSGDAAVQLAYDQALWVRDQGKYFDSHCWILTPSSFLRLMEGASELGLLTLLPDAFHPTEIDAFEFFMSFRRPAFGLAPDELKDQQLAALACMRADLEQGLRRAKLISSA
jgi:SAM-dependent methyltransferase